jgi:nucleotide-binding universal stress UspA family protein
METPPLVLAVSLEPFINLTPVALRLREEAVGLSNELSSGIDVITVETSGFEVTGFESTEEKLYRFIEPLRSSGIHARGHVLTGEPAEEIKKFVTYAGAQYLIIASHITPRLGKVSYGSTASELLQNAPATLWIVLPTKREAEMTEDMKIGEFPHHPFLID